MRPPSELNIGRNINPIVFPFLIFSVFLSFLLTTAHQSNAANAGEKVMVKAIRHSTEGGRTQVFIDLSGHAEYKEMRLSDPSRLCIDIEGGELSPGVSKKTDVTVGALRSLRAGQFSPDRARVVLEFADMEKVEKLEVKRAPKGIVVDIIGKGYKPAAKILEKSLGPIKIVVDAGHGGHDPGAVGLKGLKEKDVTLAIALKLKRILEAGKKYEVYLTRNRDAFIPLDKRAEFANRMGADLFVSVHANANPKREARGIESYILNWTDDEEAMKVAARENAITLRKMKEARSEVGMILASLELQSKRDESLRLAYLVQGSVIGGVSESYKDVADLGVKQALFYVLVGARMPSVLVEVSFISNPEEEKLLRKNSYRDELALGIAKGVAAYLESERPAIETRETAKSGGFRDGALPLKKNDGGLVRRVSLR